MAETAGGKLSSLSSTEDGVLENVENTAASLLGTEALKDIGVGAIAGMIGKTIEYPFDTVKVRLQSQPDHLPPRYTGPLDCFRQSLRAEGFPGLYRGVSAPLFGAAIEASSLFFSYRVAQNALRTLLPHQTRSKDKLPLGVLVACGGASGAFTSLLLTPIELVKCQMQVPLSSSSLQGQGPLSIILSVFRHHGIFGFWHGQLGTLIRETGGSAAWFGSYECVSAMFRKYNVQPASRSNSAPDAKEALAIYQQLLAGATAGVLYNFLFYPADTIKSRMQTEEVNARAAGRATFWASGKSLWQQQGVRGMYRGCGITVGRAAPSSALMFSVYEGLMGWLG
ncbi:hypothetical protein P7C71_g5879, partial [Lecanoromycetidae sp. Uapishka_2]